LRKLSILAASLLVAWGVIKGLSLLPNGYPLIGYLFTYADGPVRRALLPSLFSLSGPLTMLEIAYWVSVLHLAMMTVFIGIILNRFMHITESGDSLRSALVWLLLASAIIPVISVLNGYFDVLLLCSLFCAWCLLQRGHVIAPAIIIVILGLQHEMALVFGLCLMGAQFLLVAQRRTALVLAAFGVVALAAAGLYLSGLHRPELVPLAAERCVSRMPAGYPDIVNIWKIYCERHTTATFATDFKPWRPLLLPFLLMACGLFSLIIITTAVVRVRHGANKWQSLGLLGLIVLPYGLVTVALDVDRIIVMSAFTGWLILDRWIELQPERTRSAYRGEQVLLVIGVLMQLPFNYPSVDAYGLWRVMPPAVADAYLVSPRTWILPIMNRYNLLVPTILSPYICPDPRCARHDPSRL